MSGQGLYVEERRTQLQQAVQQMHTMAQAEGCDVIYGGAMIALRSVGGEAGVICCGCDDCTAIGLGGGRCGWLRHAGGAIIAL